MKYLILLYVCTFYFWCCFTGAKKIQARRQTVKYQPDDLINNKVIIVRKISKLKDTLKTRREIQTPAYKK